MPLTPEEKYKKVVDAGLDPTKFTYQEDEAPSVEGDFPFYSPPPAEEITPPTTTKLGALVSGAAQSLIPTTASVYGAGLGLRVPGPPLVKGLSALAGGLGAGYAANKLQGTAMEKFLPESMQQTLAQQQKEHDISSFIGELAPGLLFGNAGGLGSELGKIFTPATISKAKLGQAAIGAGLQTGMEGYREYKEGKADPTKLFISALAGAAQNEPTKLGRKVLGLPGVEVPPVETYVPPAQPTVRGLLPAQAESLKEPLITPQPKLHDPLGSQYEELKNRITALEQQKGIEGLREELSQQQQVQPNAEESPVLEKIKGKSREFDPLQKYKPAYQEAPEEEGVKKGVPFFGVANERAAYFKGEGEGSSAFVRDITDREDIKKGKMWVKNGPMYNKEGKRILSESGPGEPLTEEQLNTSNELAQRRNVTLQKEPGIISHKTNREARGYALPDERIARVNPNIATSDTPAHEVGHNYINDLRNSTKPSDRSFLERGINAAGSEEALVEALGKRVSEIESKPLRTWIEDSANYVGSKLGVVEENPVKGLGRRLRDDRPYSESPEFRTAIDQVNKVYSEAGNTLATSSNKGEETKGTSFNLGFLKPVVDKIREFSVPAAKAVENTEIENRQLNGKITNSFVENASKIKDKENAVRYIWESRYGQPGKVILNPADKALIDGPINKTYKLVHDEQRAHGPLIEGRQAIDNPNLKGPNIISQKTLDTLINKPSSSVDRQKLINDFVEHQVKHFDVTPEVAKENFNQLLRGFSPAGDKSNTAAFNALRKAEGFGIPWSWMEKDPVKLFQRYGNRVSRDLAYYRNIENNKEVSALFGHTKEPGVEPVVNNSIQVAQRRLTGQHTTSETTYNAIEHFVRSLLLGPVTGVKNTISTLGQILPYVSIKDIPKIAEAFGQIKRGFKDSMDLGVNRHSITSLETGDLGGGLGRFSENLKSLGDIIRKYTGSNAIEQWTRAHNMALGEILTESYWGRAAKGDINARKFLRQFAPDGETMDFRSLGKLPDNIKLETAARFVERVQGTYGLRGLPSFLLEPTSPVFWFMSLAKWSTEKANVITKDVINPAMKGDVMPLLRYGLGGMLTGEAIRAIGEELMNKKTNTPNLKEVSEKGEASDYVYKAFELSSLAGLGGLYSDLAKTVGDLGKGYSTRGYNIPSAEIAKDLVTEIGNASQAIAEGQSPVKVALSLMTNILTDNIQAVRMISNQAHPEEMNRADRFRDKRIYDKLEGKNVPAPEGRTDRYGSMAEREFKRAKTTQEAKEIYKEDIEPKLKSLPREERKDKVSNLKRNSYQTVPADRREAEKYYQYIRRTQGVDAMVKLKKDKEEQDRVNHRKGQMVH